MEKGYVLLLLCCQCVFCMVHAHIFYIQMNSTSTGFGTFYDSFGVSSIIECARKCKEDSNCRTANYVGETSLCYLMVEVNGVLNNQKGSVVLKRGPKVQWPKGTYALMKPKAGCPADWKEGWRKQDNEDEDNQNYITPGHHFFGDFGRNMIFYYCTKEANAVTGHSDWPRGNYCILRSGLSCPTGFQTGRVFWDDEDDNNANSVGGVLPSGEYDRNTAIDYCCRSDGSASTPMELPTSTPFYLLRYQESCQKVRGMLLQEENVKTDDENNNNTNSVSGSHPLEEGGDNHRLFYCYYY